jgi:xylulokinase
VAPASIAGVGITGQAPTVLLVDDDGRPVGPAILWLDVRSDGEVDDVRRRVPEAERLGGNRLHPYYAGPKLAWLRRRQPARWERASSVLQSHSYPVLRLTGARVTDHSSAALCSPLYDAGARTWAPEACAGLDVALAMLPALSAAHAVAGVVTRAAACESSVPEGTPVVVGGADFAASALAAGVTEAGEAALMLGTAGNLIMPFEGEAFDPRLINAHHVGCDRRLALGATLAGAVQEWFRRVAAPGVAHETLEGEADRVAAGADGVTLVPYLQGERTPVWDAEASGAFVGLRLDHGRGHLYRAVLEAVAVSFRHCAEVAAERGLGLREVVAVNGGGRSPLWRQILSDALGAELLYVPGHRGAAAGAALLAGLGTGVVRDVTAARAWRGPVVRHRPHESRRAVYDALLARRKEIFASLRAIA